MNKKEDIIFVTEYYPYGTGEAFIENEIEIVASVFHRVFILTTTPLNSDIRKLPQNVFLIKLKRPSRFKEILPAFFSGHSLLEFIKIIFSPHKQWFALNYFAKTLSITQCINKTINEHKINIQNLVLYSYWFTEGATAIALVKSVKNKVARAHRFDLYDYGNDLFYQPFRYLNLKKLNYILPCSNDGRDYLIGKFPKYKNKIHTSYLGVKKPKKIPSIKVHDKDLFIIISCSSVAETKRVNLILKGIATFKNKYKKKFKWIHIGSGPEFETLKIKANNLLLKDEYTFTGPLTNTEVLNFYSINQVDVLINLSSSEGLPVSMMEALSFGIPLIGSDVGGVAEIITNKTGILLDSNPSLDAISDALCYFANMTIESKKKLHENTINYYNEKFNANKNYKKFVEKYLINI